MEPRNSKRYVDNSSARRRKNNNLQSVDRISALPDSILGVILSLLPTKNAVATSILSKRWEFVWRTVHNLDFCFEDESIWVEQFEDESIWVEQFDNDKNKKFIGFVNHVLVHHDAGVLNKFRLVWTPRCIKSYTTSWIKTAITRNVQELSLTLESRYGWIDMPISIFSCDSLRSLQLERWICFSAPTMFCLPRLESLHLIGVNFQSDEAFEKVISGCPMLKYLHINIEECDSDFRFIISSTSLKHLELYLGYNKYLEIDAFSLEHLKLWGEISVKVVQKKFNSLIEADFKIQLDCDDDDFSRAIKCKSMVDAVSAFDCAKILTLSEDVMETLSGPTITLSTDFKRLVELETHIVCCHWRSLQDFIQSSNNLQVLVVHKSRRNPEDENDHDHSNWTTPIEVPRCLSTSLKQVGINGYYGYNDEREMIRYMLKHGSVLEIMQICLDFNTEVNGSMFELIQEISLFPRMSDICEIKFFWWTMTSEGRKDLVCCTIQAVT